MKRCPSCNASTPDWMATCPKCGTIIPKTKSSVHIYAVVAVIVIIAIAVVAALLMQQPCKGPNCGGGPPPTFTVAPTPTQPLCSPPPALNAIKQPGGTIRITVMGGQCLSDVREFEVRVNGVPANVVLPTTAGSSATVTGSPDAGKDSLTVVAHYRNGQDMVVLSQSV